MKRRRPKQVVVTEPQCSAVCVAPRALPASLLEGGVPFACQILLYLVLLTLFPPQLLLTCAQAPGDDSEVLLKPCAVYRDPFRADDIGNIIVLCDCYKPDPDGESTLHF